MKKRYINILIILIAFILTFGFSNNIFAEDLKHGVEPLKVTSHFIGETEFGPFNWYFVFWNIGALGGEKYSKATAKYTQSSDKDILRSGTYEGTFTGGPNGVLTFKVEGYGEMNLQLQNGRYIDCGEFGTAEIDNPEAFDGWMDQELAGTMPTIELLILDGPVAIGDGALRWTVKAIATGDPEPTIEFSCNPADGMSATGNENVITITVPNDKIYELTATADNWNLNGPAIAVSTFVNEESGAKFSDFSGQVEIRPHNDEEAWSSAKLDSKLYVDMHIRTGDNSTAILSFTDASTFHLKPNTEIVLSSAHGEKISNLKLLWGHMMLNVKKMMKDGSMIQEMQNAAASIKGTTLVLSETGTESTVKVIEGTVEFKLLDSSQSVMVSKGESVTASNNELSEKTIFDPAEELKSWETIAGKTIETSSDVQTGTIQGTPESVDKTQKDTLKETADATIQKKSAQLSPTHIILIIAEVLLILMAIIVIVLILKSKKKGSQRI